MELAQSAVDLILAILITGSLGWIFRIRFQRLERALERHEDRTDKRFEEVGKRFAEIGRRFEEMSEDIRQLRADVGGLRSDLTRVALAVGVRREPNAG